MTIARSLFSSSVFIAAVPVSIFVILIWTLTPAPVAYGQNNSFNIAIAGDWGCTDDARKTASSIEDKYPELVLMPGDFSYEISPNSWYEIIAPFASKSKIAIGNHDAEENGSEKLRIEYLNKFNLTQSFYSFSYNNTHVLVMDTQSPYEWDSPQYKFVKEDLQAASINSSIDWIFVMYHKPMYSQPAAHSGSDTLRNVYHPLFDQFGVDLVVQAHNHMYERTYPLHFNPTDMEKPIFNSSNTTNTGIYESPSNPIFATVGTGGHSLYRIEEYHPYVGCSSDNHYGFLNIDIVNDEMLNGKFYANSNGTDLIIDNFTIIKNNQVHLNPTTASHCASKPSTSLESQLPSTPISGSVGTFYYPWYGHWKHWADGDHNPPNTWASNYLPDLNSSVFDPSTELYDSSDQAVVTEQIREMERVGINFSISSWWGQTSPTDTVFSNIIANPENGPLKWALLYEEEGFGNPTVADLVSDLNYIKTEYTNDEDYLKIDGKPVIFVYNAEHTGSNALEDLDRWKQARQQTDFYVVFKVDPLLLGANPEDMDSWYQYAPAVRYEIQGSYSAMVSPGFWKYHESPRLERDVTEFDLAVRELEASNVQFKLIETWNEWGEGTGVEPAQTIIHDDVNGFSAAEQSYGDTYLNILARYFGGKNISNNITK
jgi:Calcineurin-like phosphoesterase/Glycosyl hydrolase family 99